MDLFLLGVGSGKLIGFSGCTLGWGVGVGIFDILGGLSDSPPPFVMFTDLPP